MSLEIIAYLVYIVVAAGLIWALLHVTHIRKALQPKCDKAIIAEKTIKHLPYKTSFKQTDEGEETSYLKGNFMILKSKFKYKNDNYEITSLADESELVDERKKLENSNATKSAFVANMSNEIRKPLNGIVGYSQLLIDEEDSNLLKEYSSVLETHSNELLEVINDVLTLTTLQTSSVVNREKIDTVEFLTAMRLYAISLVHKAQKDIQIVVDHPYKEAAYYEDRDRLAQVAQNYIDNAIKFSEKGVIRIGMVHIENNQAVFYVADEGVGINEDEVEALFHKPGEEQLQESDRGLGLSICREILTSANGQYGAVNRPTGGSVFWAFTPLRFTYVSPDANADWEAINDIIDKLPIKLND